MPTTAGRLSEARHDGGMRGAAAGLRDDAADQFAVEAGGVGGREIVREHDGRHVHALEFRLRLALQVAQHAAGDVREIGGAFAEVIVVELAHLPGVDAHHLLIGEVDIHEPAEHLLLDRLDERAVLEREDVRVENARVGLADGGGHLVADGGDLLAGLEQRGLEPGQFIRDIFRADAPLAHDVLVRIEQDSGAPNDPRRDGETFVSCFGCGRWGRRLVGHGATLLTLRRICELLIPRALSRGRRSRDRYRSPSTESRSRQPAASSP